MGRAWAWAAACAWAGACVGACADDPALVPATAAAASDAGAPPTLPYAIDPAPANDVVAPIRTRYGLPAIAALVYRNGTVVAEGVDGVRKLGDPTPVARNDLFAIGEDVQVMTATLAAVLVQKGLVGWTTSLGETGLPMHAGYTNVTLEQLLGQRGGAPAATLEATRDPDARDRAVRAILAVPPEAPVGTFHESDASFLLANAILEAKTGRTWEILVGSELFAPLGMASCAYTTSGDLPWGHAGDVPVDPTDPREPPAALAPASGIRCSLEDWGRFAAFHLHGARAEPVPLLAPPSFAKLQTPPSLTHALGWEAVSRAWAGAALALVRTSKSSTSYAVMWVLPDKNTAILAATNRGGSAAEKALDDVVLELVGRFVPP